jgi:hypothetical protein
MRSAPIRAPHLEALPPPIRGLLGPVALELAGFCCVGRRSGRVGGRASRVVCADQHDHVQ